MTSIPPPILPSSAGASETSQLAPVRAQTVGLPAQSILTATLSGAAAPATTSLLALQVPSGTPLVAVASGLLVQSATVSATGQVTLTFVPGAATPPLSFSASPQQAQALASAIDSQMSLQLIPGQSALPASASVLVLAAGPSQQNPQASSIAALPQVSTAPLPQNATPQTLLPQSAGSQTGPQILPQAVAQVGGAQAPAAALPPVSIAALPQAVQSTAETLANINALQVGGANTAVAAQSVTLDVRALQITAWPVSSVDFARQISPADLEQAPVLDNLLAGVAENLQATAPSGGQASGAPGAQAGAGGFAAASVFTVSVPQSPSAATAQQVTGQLEGGGQTTGQVTAQLPNGFSVLQINGGLWMTKTIPNLMPAGGTLILTPLDAGVAELAAGNPKIPGTAQLAAPLAGSADPAIQAALAEEAKTGAMVAAMVLALRSSLLDPSLPLAMRLMGQSLLLATTLERGLAMPMLQGDAETMEEIPQLMRDGFLTLMTKWQAGAAAEQMAQLVDQSGRNWQTARVPESLASWFLPFQFFIQRQPQGGSHKGKNERRRQSRKIRFLIDIRFNRFGQTQLDGLAGQKSLDLALRSETKLAEDLRRSLSGRFAELGALCGFQGQLSFQDGPSTLLRWERKGAADQMASL